MVSYQLLFSNVYVQRWRNILNFLPTSSLSKLEDAQEKLIKQIEELDKEINSLPPIHQPVKLHKTMSSETNISQSTIRLSSLKRKSSLSKEESKTPDNKYSMKLSLEKTLSAGSKRAEIIGAHSHDQGGAYLCKTCSAEANEAIDVGDDECILKFLYEQEVYAELKKTAVDYLKYHKLSLKEGTPATYTIQRANFNFLPISLAVRLSGEHAKVVFERDEKGQKKIEFRDSSKNGSYVWVSPPSNLKCKQGALELSSPEFVEVKARSVELQDGSIVGLVMKKTRSDYLLFGFQVMLSRKNS